MEAGLMKACLWCRQEKPMSEYHPARGYRDGHMNHCKACHAEKERLRARGELHAAFVAGPRREPVAVEFWLGGDRRFVHKVPALAIQKCCDLPPKSDRFAYWRMVTGDDRIDGHVLVWSFERGNP